MRFRLLVALGIATTLSVSCASSKDAESDRESSADAGRGGNSGGGDAPGADAGIAGNDAGLPPEIEETVSFESPQAGRTSVYIANPTTNRVAVVNAGTFNIESIAVGAQPTYTATVPGQDIAIVLNVGARDAALLRTDEGRTRVVKLAVGHDANAIAIAPDGLHAVLYLNASTLGTTGAQSFQDLTVVDLTPGSEKTQRVSVGFRPRGVQFTRDGRRAFVITEDGVSILDFAALASGSGIAPLVSLGDSLRDPQSVDVQVTADGAFALARREGESTLRLIALADGRVETLSLASLMLPVVPGAGAPDAGTPSGEPALTDLDVAADGSFAIAVLRDRGALVRIPLPAGFRDPTTLRVRLVSEQLIGSVTLAKTGKSAIAYTTVQPVESVVVIDDVSSDMPARGVRLRKAVRAVALSDDGARALILHKPVGVLATGISEDARIDASEGYSVLDTQRGFAKLQLTGASVRERDLLITPERKRLFALLRNDAQSVRSVEMVDLDSFQVTQVALAGPPTSLGMLPGLARVFVGQAGEGGAITFLDALTGARLRNISGFEIASRIRQ